MSKVVCVLYDDPVDGYPKSYARDKLPKIDEISRWSDRSHAASDRFQARRNARQRLRRAGPAEVSRKGRPHTRRDVRQGRQEFQSSNGSLPTPRS